MTSTLSTLYHSRLSNSGSSCGPHLHTTGQPGLCSCSLAIASTQLPERWAAPALTLSLCKEWPLFPCLPSLKMGAIPSLARLVIFLPPSLFSCVLLPLPAHGPIPLPQRSGWVPFISTPYIPSLDNCISKKSMTFV